MRVDLTSELPVKTRTRCKLTGTARIDAPDGAQGFWFSFGRTLEGLADHVLYYRGLNNFNTILGVPYYNCSIMGPKTLF